jgi:hypothetical protein
MKRPAAYPTAIKKPALVEQFGTFGKKLPVFIKLDLKW